MSDISFEFADIAVCGFFTENEREFRRVVVILLFGQTLTGHVLAYGKIGGFPIPAIVPFVKELTVYVRTISAVDEYRPSEWSPGASEINSSVGTVRDQPAAEEEITVIQSLNRARSGNIAPA